MNRCKINRDRLFCMSGYLYALIIFLTVGAVVAGDLTWPQLKAAIKKDYPSVTHITTHSLAQWLADSSKPPPLLLDVRAQKEFRVSHLKNAKWTPDKTAAVAHLKHADKNQPIVVYCSVGYRSAALAATLKKLGYQKVLNLEGSIFQWRNEGRHVFSNSKKTSVVHPYNHKWGKLLHPKYHGYK